MTSAIISVGYLLFAISLLAIGIPSLCGYSFPQAVQDLFWFGKLRKKKRQHSFAQALEVPKSYFSHFYILGLLANTYSLVNIVRAYIFAIPPPALFTLPMRTVQTSDDITTDAAAVLVAQTLMVVQMAQRLSACLCVSTFSASTMSAMHYVWGLGFYTGFHVALLSGAPPLDTTVVRLSDFGQWSLLLGVVLFLWASSEEYRIHAQLADLRKNKKGFLLNKRHHMPAGGWFDLVSCPHFFMEILIYVSFIIVLGPRHWTISAMAVTTFVNQVIAGVATNRLYRSEFPAYPATTKAVIPYLL